MKEILIKNVTILTMDDENSRFFGWILLKNGKIDALGEGEPPGVQRGARRRGRRC